jgi:divalent metal cation (Fe/Co/Zn/Cd) transporter
MVSLALIVAAIVIGIESIKRIQELHPLPKPYTLWVLLAVVGIKILLSRCHWCGRESGEHRCKE